MNTQKILEKIGLNKHESVIYLALLELGPSLITDISQKTAIHRPLVYKALPSLLEKKLITQTERGKQTLYVAEPPNRLESIFEDVKMEFFEMLPDLEDVYVKNTQKGIKVRFLEGKTGTMRVFDDVVRSLKKDEEFYRISSNKDGTEKRDKYVPRSYRRIRDAKRLQRLVITNSQTAENKTTKLERLIKVMPNDNEPFEYNVTEIVYGDRVAFIDYSSETAMIIENKNVADFQKHIFKTLYKKI